jgi:hypothetical protein
MANLLHHLKDLEQVLVSGKWNVAIYLLQGRHLEYPLYMTLCDLQKFSDGG